jgi:hypothetical protein
MRQIRQRTARATRPTPDTTAAQPPARPVVRNWLDRLDPSTDPWPRPIIRTHREGR